MSNAISQAEAALLLKDLDSTKTTWVERQVPECLENVAHELITALLKSFGYNWEGEKDD